MKKALRFLLPAILALILVSLKSCAGNEPEPDKPKPHQAPVKIVSPANLDQFTLGDIIEVKLEFNDPADVNNLSLFVDDTLFQGNLKNENQSLQIDTRTGRVGHVKIYLSFEDSKGEKHGDTRTIDIFSDTEPGHLRAVSINELPHDKSSYTQGLEFYQGKLFEGTGQYGTSVLSEVDLNTGKRIREHALESRYFGEGITILNDTIYQLSWVEQTCFVYDMTFNPIKEFSYNGEGWGLCNNGQSLIMTNGTSEIVWRNPATFEVQRRIHAFDDQKEIGSLNELELINGHLFINVYTEDYIIEVDTLTGKVINQIDCKELVTKGRKPGSDVLNGIAYNAASGKIYMTGKWWPTMFEVKFEPWEN